MKKHLLIITTIIFSSINNFYGQGCSDAGFCTLNSIKPNNNNDSTEHQNLIKIGASYGAADKGITIGAAYLEYVRSINNELTIDAKVTAIRQSGNQITENGLSDIFINLAYKIQKKSTLFLGAKIPLSDSNTKNLPLHYQSSLGTYDIIVGAAYEIYRFQLTAAYQQPLRQNNNKFRSENYPSTSILNSFQSSYNFKRAGDFLFRLSYPVTINESFKVTPSILPIYHLQNDEYTNIVGLTEKINGSQGLTLNGTIYIDIQFNKKSGIQLNAGMPFINRNARPDGLTREYIATIEYKLQF